jgi:hypothetical protein
MSEPMEPDDTELEPELSALLRDEPVAIDPARREAAISAALELGSTILPAVPTASSASVDGATGGDELAARRRSTSPGRVSSRPADRRRGLLVAAAVVVVGGLGAAGILANLGSNGTFVNTSADEASSGAMADSAPPEATTGGGDGGGDGDVDALQRNAAEDAVTTTAPPMSQGSQAEAAATADLGTFDTVEELLGQYGLITGPTAAAPGDAAFDGGGACSATIAASGITVTGRAVVGTTPVVVGSIAPDGTTIVVLDAVTCVELGRR